MHTPELGPDEFMTSEELAQRYKNQVTKRTLTNWRSLGEGPKYTKIGGRVLYALSDVLRWEISRKIGRVGVCLLMQGDIWELMNAVI